MCISAMFTIHIHGDAFRTKKIRRFIFHPTHLVPYLFLHFPKNFLIHFFCMKIRKWSKNSKMRKSRLPSHGSMKTRLVDTKICIIIVPYGFIELKADWTECQYYGEEGKLLLWRPWPHCLSEVPEPIQQGIIVVRRLDIFFTFLASVKHK